MPDDEEFLLEGQPSPLSRVTDFVKSHLGFIAVLLVLIVVVWVYLNVLPHSTTLKVNVSELDGNAVDADVTVSANGKVLKSGTTDGGFIAFTGIPTRTELQIDVDPSAYSSVLKKATHTLTLNSDEGGSASIDLERAYSSGLELGEVTPAAGLIGEGCAPTFQLPVTNKNTNAVTLELASNSPDAFSSSDSQTLAAGETKSLSFTITPPTTASKSSSFSVAVRVKHTNQKKDLSFTVGDPAKLSLSPSEIHCPDSGCTKAVTITLTNSGKSPITDIVAQLIGEFQSGDITFTSYNEGQHITLGPDEKYTFFVKVTSSAKGKVGKLRVTSSCPPPLEIAITP